MFSRKILGIAALGLAAIGGGYTYLHYNKPVSAHFYNQFRTHTSLRLFKTKNQFHPLLILHQYSLQKNQKSL